MIDKEEFDAILERLNLLREEDSEEDPDGQVQFKEWFRAMHGRLYDKIMAEQQRKCPPGYNVVGTSVSFSGRLPDSPFRRTKLNRRPRRRKKSSQ